MEIDKPMMFIVYDIISWAQYEASKLLCILSLTWLASHHRASIYTLVLEVSSILCSNRQFENKLTYENLCFL